MHWSELLHVPNTANSTGNDALFMRGEESVWRDLMGVMACCRFGAGKRGTRRPWSIKPGNEVASVKEYLV